MKRTKFTSVLLTVIISATCSTVFANPAKAAVCSSVDKGIYKKLVVSYGLASFMGDEASMTTLFDDVESGIKKSKSAKLKAALKKLLAALEADSGSGKQFSYVPSINGAWNTIKTIADFNRC